MVKSFMFFVLSISILLMTISCNNGEYQYDIYVKNQTDEILQVAFKSNVDRKGVVEETLVVQAGEFRKIINSTDIAVPEYEDYGRTSSKHSRLVAEYVNASQNGNPSKIKWNDERIQFIRTDIGQAEFVITYTEDDF